MVLNLKTQYSIIGGSTSTFVLVLVFLSLLQTPGAPLPITPIGEQIISNQTNDNEDIDNPPETIPDYTVEEIVLPPSVDEITADEGLTNEIISANVVRSFRSGGGGGGGTNSNNEDFSYNLQLVEDEEASDGSIELGQDIDAIATTNDISVDEVIFKWIDPTNEVVRTQIISLESESSTSNFEPQQIGRWVVEADFGNGQVLREDLDVSFLVIPESPIGVLALIGASIATLGAYALLRGRII